MEKWKLPAHLQLVEFMKENDVTQSVLARHLRAWQPDVSLWCRGRATPTVRFRWLIQLITGIEPLDWFYDDRDVWIESLECIVPLIDELRPTARRTAHERIDTWQREEIISAPCSEQCLSGDEDAGDLPGDLSDADRGREDAHSDDVCVESSSGGR